MNKRINLNLSASTQVIVVTYNPEMALLNRNLDALVKQFQNILIVDNNSNNVAEIERTAIKHKVELDKLSENFGIAYAQNIGLREANNRKLGWLLTMDQDSIIPKNLTEEYEKNLIKYKNVGLIGWDQRTNGTDVELVKDDWWIVSSGCLTSVSALNKVGGFDNTLFIDHVDTDVNIKIKNLGLKTLVTNKVKLYHQLGVKTGQKTVRGDYYHAHSSIRVYYIIRNGLVIFRRYFFKQPIWMLQALKTCFREGMYLLCFQPNKLSNTGLILKAWFDGVFNRLGKLEK